MSISELLNSDKSDKRRGKFFDSLSVGIIIERMLFSTAGFNKIMNVIYVYFII